MLTYRCYLLDGSDRIKSFIEVRAFSDAEAIAAANAIQRKNSVGPIFIFEFSLASLGIYVRDLLTRFFRAGRRVVGPSSIALLAGW